MSEADVGRRGCSFPQIFCYFFLQCNRWQQRSSLTKWCLTWKHRWSEVVSFNSSMQEKNAPTDITSTGTDCYKCSKQVLIHYWSEYIVVVTVLKNHVLSLFVSVLFPWKLNRRHYFQSNLSTSERSSLCSSILVVTLSAYFQNLLRLYSIFESSVPKFWILLV